jgi:hypothetical protein
MAFTTKLANQVDSDIRQRGNQYFMRGAVRIIHGDKKSVEATVQGTRSYLVNVERRGKTVKVSCDCPYFEDHGLTCMHIWATLLAADGRGYLRGSDNSSPSYLEEDLPEWEEEDEWDDPYEDYGEYDYDDGNGYDEGRGYYRAYSPRPPSFKQPVRQAPRKKPKPLNWKKSLAGLRNEMEQRSAPRGITWPAERVILYVIDVSANLTGPELVLEIGYRTRKKDGDWSKPKFERIQLTQVPKLPDPADRQILSLLIGAREDTPYYSSYGYNYYESTPRRYRLSAPLQETLMPQVCRTGRCFLRRSPDDEDLQELHWDEGPPWEFWLKITLEPSGKRYLMGGELRRGEERLSLTTPVLLTRGGLVFWEGRVARVQDFGAFDWILLLRKSGPLPVAVKEKDNLLNELLRLPRLPRLDLPEELRFEEVTPTLRPRLKIKAPDRHRWGSPLLRGELSFDYEGAVVAADQMERGVYQPEQRRLLVRNQEAEYAAAELIRQLGFQRSTSYYNHHPELQLTPRKLPHVVRTLVEAGWHVEAEGKLYRNPGEIRIEVSSGIDWFELHGGVKFGDTEAKLPALLAALRRGENTVQLDDGTFGMLPEQWLKKYGLLAGLGTVEKDHLRFTRTQAGLLDALLASQPEATYDKVFAQVRDELRSFAGIEPTDPPAGFVGKLRGYQCEGLGWLYFLQKFGFGGCLADDMGLGKTVQVLALLESRRELRTQKSAKKRPAPSLVVVPRSLVFNWIQEAARFTPELRILDHTGNMRLKPGEHFNDYDLVITTYGTLRRDALYFKDVSFDYCILDEAQAIKNASTESAKAVRLLRGDHRLALSGTPVENHLGELWSLFEFLNPGMLGSASVFRLAGVGARNPDEETRALLARALRPFILRRTKAQVAKDLPPKLEQTIFCELESEQRRLYDELREHYRQALLARIERDGINKAKIQILEALLRLRQAACHPGLIDKKRVTESSAKLDTLLPQLAEVLEGGHKALVFSQFTSLLAIVRHQLKQEKIPYEYLDGQTRDRAARVERFQKDPDCKLFLISLKAGGLGLNLTAAEYVFLLDPWWNPAVEAQAIDRTHRIGQTRPVFAYRLIARDTVEEKVLELQKTKRDLADAIINADNSLIRNLGREDLELLLS